MRVLIKRMKEKKKMTQLSHHLERELSFIRATAPPYVPPEQRLQPTYPTNYPHPVDVAHVAWNHPIEHAEEGNASVWLEQIRSGFTRHSWEDKLAYANRPHKGKPLAMNIAEHVGHQGGLVGLYKNHMPDEISPAFGGGCPHW